VFGRFRRPGRQSLASPPIAAALRVILVGKTVGKMQHALIIGDGAQPWHLSRLRLRYSYIVDSIATRVPTMPARRSPPTLAAAGVFCGLGLVIRPNALRILFGLMLGILAALLIGALPRTMPSKSTALSSAFALRISPTLPGITH
jgi:hypothetical protein